MRVLSAIVAVSLLWCGAALGATYSTDFEADTIGSMPAGWYLFTPWWDVGTITAGVAAAPGGGQAMKIEWGTDWASYDFTSGEAGYTADLGGLDGATAIMVAEYDFYSVNDRIWQMFSDQGTDLGCIHMHDSPENDGKMQVNWVDALNDVPRNTWIHVSHMVNAATGEWETSISYPGGSGGGVFSGSADPAGITLMGEYWFGGWMFKLQSDADPSVPYDNGLYIDNFSLTVIPEPASLLLLAIGGLALRRRR